MDELDNEELKMVILSPTTDYVDREAALNALLERFEVEAYEKGKERAVKSTPFVFAKASLEGNNNSDIR